MSALATTTTTPPDTKPRESRLALSLPQVWVVVAVALAVAFSIGGLMTVDLAYQLRAGNLMLATHHFIRTDTFSFTAFGRPWLDQQWGAQVFLAFVFRHLGWAGLSLAKGVLVGITFSFVYLACRAAGISKRPAAWLTIGSFFVSVTDLAMRPQLLAAPLFAISLWIVMGRRAHPGRLWAIPAIVAVWANVHGTFWLPLLLLGLAWVEDRVDKVSGSGRLLGIAAVSALAANLNPYGFRVWGYVVNISTNPAIRNTVTEWNPPTVRHFDDALFFLSAVAVAFVLARRGRATPWPAMLSLGVFFFLGLTATRNTLWWGLAAPPILAGVLKQDARPPRRQPAPNVLNTVLVCIVVIGVALAFPWSLVGKPSDAPGSRVTHAPPGITADLQRVLRPGERVFNAQEWGSWFEFALPRNPSFVDSRIEIFPDSVWRDYNNVSAGKQGWQAILNRWNVGAVVLSRTQQPSLIPFISRDPGWRLQYRNSDGLVFVRR